MAPVGVPDAPLEADTVAAKVTNWPNTLGFGEAAIVVAEEFLLIVCVSGDDVADVLFASPGYCAVRT
jgi:hypothetical protein